MSHTDKSKNGSIKKTIVHTIFLTDEEVNVELAIIASLYNWEHSEAGRWIMKNSVKVPIWRKMVDLPTNQYKCEIAAYLHEVDLTYWKLKYE